MSEALASSPRSILSMIGGPDEIAALNREKEGAQTEVMLWLERCKRLAEAPHGSCGTVAKQISAGCGASVATIYNKKKAYDKKGWRGLIPRNKYPEPDTAQALPAAFRDWIAHLFEQYQRDWGGAQVHRYLLDRWRQWMSTLDPQHKIPGYDVPPPSSPEGHPYGWSLRNIQRLKPDSINLTISRRGPKAAHSHLPSNYTTRAGLAFLQRIFFDDQEYDTKVVLGTQKKPLRPHGFNSIDHLSGSWLDVEIKATRWDGDAQRKRVLTQRDFTFFNLRGLLTHGYRADKAGTTLIFEHGTTTAFNNKELSTLPWRGHHSFHNYDEALNLITEGCVSVDRSGKFNQPMFADMLFRPQSTGNFRFKSPIESMFNLVRNHMAALPGATGQDRDHAPEESHGADRYHEQLAKLAGNLPTERRDRIQRTYHNFYEFCAIAREIYDIIDHRTDHKLEGWAECGFVQPHFRIDPSTPWLLEDQIRARLQDPAKLDAFLSASEMKGFALSPAQARAALKHDPAIKRLNPDLVPFLLPREWAYDIEVKKNHELHLTDPDLYPGARAIFVAQFGDRNSKTVLRAGRKLKAWWHPIVDRLWVTTPDLEYIGCLRELVKPTAGDRPVILRNQGRITSLKETLVSDTVRRAAGEAQERQRMKSANDRLKDPDAAVTPEEKKKQRAADRLTKPQERRNRTGMKLTDI